MLKNDWFKDGRNNNFYSKQQLVHNNDWIIK